MAASNKPSVLCHHFEKTKHFLTTKVYQWISVRTKFKTKGGRARTHSQDFYHHPGANPVMSSPNLSTIYEEVSPLRSYSTLSDNTDILAERECTDASNFGHVFIHQRSNSSRGHSNPLHRRGTTGRQLILHFV
jgi:hypothetical protein